MSDIFEEAKEDAKIEQIINFWRVYGKYILSVIAVALIVLAGYFYIESAKHLTKEKQANLYHELILSLEDGNVEKFDEDLASFLKDNDLGYALLAQLRAAAEEFKKTGVVATDLYEKIWSDKKVDEKVRDLSVILWSLQGMDVLDAEKMLTKLESIATSNRIFSALALETMAYVFVRANDLPRARETFSMLIESKGASNGIKLRARAMLSRLTPNS
ncbi:MAG: tetratricopeptide repeat protein [Alphaproteobacteria bacterium]|nr:tetratricopeptide repeat protein [Alphaproteobacteria bacterium]